MPRATLNVSGEFWLPDDTDKVTGRMFLGHKNRLETDETLVSLIRWEPNPNGNGFIERHERGRPPASWSGSRRHRRRRRPVPIQVHSGWRLAQHDRTRKEVRSGCWSRTSFAAPT